MLTLFRTFNLRYLSKHKLRTATIIFGVSLGIIMVVATMLVNQSILRSYRSLIDTAAGKTGLQVMPNTRSGLPASMVDEVASVKGIKAAVPLVISDTLVSVKDKPDGGLLVYGIDPKKDTAARDYTFTKGRQIKAGETSSIVITKTWADENKLALGDRIGLVGVNGIEKLTIVGLLAETGPGHTNAGQFAVMDITAARYTFNRTGKVDQVDLILKADEKPETVQRRVKALLNGRAEVEIPSARGGDVQKSLDSMAYMLNLAAILALFVGTFLIFNNLEISVEERRFGISTLRALGLGRRKIFSLVIAEAIMLGFIGSLFGTIVGAGLARVMSGGLTGYILTMEKIRATDFGLTPQILAMGLLMGPLVSALAAIGPATRMLNVAPLEALKPFETAWRPASSTWKLIVSALVFFTGIGIIIAVVALPSMSEGFARDPNQLRNLSMVSIFLSFLGSVLLMPHLLSSSIGRGSVHSFVLRTALDNLRRVPGRTSATVTGMMIALTMMIGMSALVTSMTRLLDDEFNKMLGWDILVQTTFFNGSANVPMTENFGKKLATVKGIKAMTTFTTGYLKINDNNVMLHVLDMNTYFDVNDLIPQDGKHEQMVRDLKKRGTIVVSTMLAKKFGYKKGDIVTLNTPSGKKPFKITALINYFSQEPGILIVGRGDYKEYWKDDAVDGFEMKLEKGQSIAATSKAIKDRWGKSHGIQVREGAEFKKQISGMISQAFSLNNLLVYIALIVAAFGIINSSLISILQRSRELSTLRALGARRRQIKNIIRNEGLIMGAMGGVLGALLGVGLGKSLILVSANTYDLPLAFYVPWPAILIGFAVAIGFTGIGSAIPSKAALKREIVEGLSYE